MKNLLKVLAGSVIVFFIVLFVTMTFKFIRKVWFGKSSGDHVAVLEISGVLTSSESKVRLLEKISEDKATKALVVRVNSPGGLVAPSQELYLALKRLDEKIPVVISMGPLAASGGYYLALGGRKIVANPGTLTASIGVIIEIVNTQKLYQWAKVERYAITGGKFKSIGTPFRPMTPEERALLTAMVENIHGQFKQAVQERRQLTDEQMNIATDGRIMTGQQALEVNLVDKLGDLHTALDWAKEMAGLPKDAKVIHHEPQPGLLFKILLGDDAASGEMVWQRIAEEARGMVSVPGWRLLLLSPVR